MSHKYLNKIGIKSTDTCIFNTEEKDDSRNKRFKKQRKKYGFDERETWSMDYTLASWIYEHFMLYKKINCVDLTFHKFDIPKWDDKILDEKVEITQEEGINLVLNNIKFFLKNEDFDKELEAYERYKYALIIMAEIMPAMWW